MTKESKRTIFLSREEVIHTLENLYVNEGGDEENEMEGNFQTLKTHLKDFESMENGRKNGIKTKILFSHEDLFQRIRIRKRRTPR